MGKPFEIEVDCGSANPVTFTLPEDYLRASRNFKVQSAVSDNHGDPDDRTRLWRGALQVARNLLERSTKPNPTEIYDLPDVWIIPEGSVRWIKLHDPESKGATRREMGFKLGADEQG